MTKKNETGELGYDPYAKEKEPQFSIHDLLEQQEQINANIEGREYTPNNADEEEEIDISKMKVDELKAALDEVGVAYTSDDKKADLVKLYGDYLDAQGEGGEGGEGEEE